MTVEQNSFSSQHNPSFPYPHGFSTHQNKVEIPLSGPNYFSGGQPPSRSARLADSQNYNHLDMTKQQFDALPSHEHRANRTLERCESESNWSGSVLLKNPKSKELEWVPCFVNTALTATKNALETCKNTLETCKSQQSQPSSNHGDLGQKVSSNHSKKSLQNKKVQRQDEKVQKWMQNTLSPLPAAFSHSPEISRAALANVNNPALISTQNQRGSLEKSDGLFTSTESSYLCPEASLSWVPIPFGILAGFGTFLLLQCSTSPSTLKKMRALWRRMTSRSPSSTAGSQPPSNVGKAKSSARKEASTSLTPTNPVLGESSVNILLEQSPLLLQPGASR